MSIRDIVDNSDPDEAARVAVDIARSIVARGTARADVVALAEGLLKLGAEQIADVLRQQPERAAESPNALNPNAVPAGVVVLGRREQSATAHQIALSGIRLAGTDLILTLTGLVELATQIEVVANGTNVEFRPAGSGGVVQAINVHREITDAQLSRQITDNGLAVRISQYRDRPGMADGVAAQVQDNLTSSLDQWNGLIGPFYDVAGVARRLDISTDAVQHRARRHQLLGCMTSDGTLVFPTFQIDQDGTVLPGLADILAILSSATDDRWQVALWMTTPSTQLHGRTPVDALKRQETQVVRLLAIRTAGRWRPRYNADCAD
ncbi:DUF2384 domain-containing protein [Mycobacterium avium subsp. hominissuis]|uniref:antitoxin Xre/MbcA/ParS toxin-binding domain-containing protein n=1 Tax=Mycobacterium TaxID=1763 RepID=UPI001140ACD2|nr:antitoxin Xre/MbcA/ParS toxin-binding domain-containing protein [Mycobacterium avium]MDO2384353.1 DUF2384 domain-containing protein [Mycobacterium avium subsp. hominissuis]MDO2395905.1 DUF2384 domain-containing protein [Mycobacterium avium subsp. hominissuis]